MPRKYICPVEGCGRTFTSSKALDEHFNREHVGKLDKDGLEYAVSVGIPAWKMFRDCERVTKEAFEYAVSLGVSPEELLKICRKYGTKLLFDVESWMREHRKGQSLEVWCK
ncbi:MAG: hypothetical protein ACXQS2_01530 [Methermicoccaceae archaeon]